MLTFLLFYAASVIAVRLICDRPNYGRDADAPPGSAFAESFALWFVASLWLPLLLLFVVILVLPSPKPHGDQK